MHGLELEGKRFGVILKGSVRTRRKALTEVKRFCPILKGKVWTRRRLHGLHDVARVVRLDSSGKISQSYIH